MYFKHLWEKKTIECESENYSNENTDFFPAPAEASNQYQKVLYDGTSESNIADVQKLPICFNNSGVVLLNYN